MNSRQSSQIRSMKRPQILMFALWFLLSSFHHNHDPKFHNPYQQFIKLIFVRSPIFIYLNLIAEI